MSIKIPLNLSINRLEILSVYSVGISQGVGIIHIYQTEMKGRDT